MNENKKDSRHIVYSHSNANGESIFFTLRGTPGDRDCFFHAVNKTGFNRTALVDKLINNITEETLAIFAHEIRQFLYLGFTAGHEDEKENQACQELLTEEVVGLFSKLQDAETQLRILIKQARSCLGEAKTRNKVPAELLSLLYQTDSKLAAVFEDTYQAVLKVDKEIYDYCSRDLIFLDYIKLYLVNARGYIPFSREFGSKLPATPIDVINKLFSLNIQVYLKHKDNPTQLIVVNQPQLGEYIPIFHNGINHFWGLNATNPNFINNKNDKKTSFDTLIEQALNVNEQFASSLQDFQVKAIQKELKNIPTAVKLSLERIVKLASQETQLKSTLQTEMERIRKLIDSKIGFIESNSHNYLEKIQAIELLGNIINQYAELTSFLNPSPSAKVSPISRWNDDRLRLEQQIACKEEQVTKELNILLNNIKDMAEINFSVPNQCFISYAWASTEASHEYWIQPFLIHLREHLRQAGVNAILDIKDSPAGGNIYQYMDKVKTADCVILVGTESLFQKHVKGTTAVCNELILINNKRAQNNGKTLPIILSGDFANSLPPYFLMYTCITDWRDSSYIANLKNILASIYDIGPDNNEYNALWEEFGSKYSYLMQGLIEEDVNQQLSKEQELKSQEKELNSQQVSELFTNVNNSRTSLRQKVNSHSQNLNSFNCKFQRPNKASHFVERKKINDEIIRYFAQEKKGLLTLILYGLGGAGKTSLAQNYYLTSEQYTVRAWFNAETKSSIGMQYIYP